MAPEIVTEPLGGGGGGGGAGEPDEPPPPLQAASAKKARPAGHWRNDRTIQAACPQPNPLSSRRRSLERPTLSIALTKSEHNNERMPASDKNSERLINPDF
jgi:hypothetical protein